MKRLDNNKKVIKLPFQLINHNNNQIMEEDVKQILAMIVHERMKLKVALDRFRILEEMNIKKSYQREIDYCLDCLKQLDDLV